MERFTREIVQDVIEAINDEDKEKQMASIPVKDGCLTVYMDNAELPHFAFLDVDKILEILKPFDVKSDVLDVFFSDVHDGITATQLEKTLEEKINSYFGISEIIEF